MESHQNLLAQAVRYVAGSLGHELNNHLTVIVGNLALAKRQAPQAEKALNHIEKAVESVHAKTLGLTTLAQELGGARQPIDLKVTLEEALAVVTGMQLSTVQDLSALDTPSPVQVRMDASMLPMALYFAIHAFAVKGANDTAVNARLLPESEVEITIAGPRLGVDADLAERASSRCPGIILGQDACALGLSATKAFTHRCQGRLEVVLAADGSGSIQIILPIVRAPRSFLPLADDN